MRPSFYSMAIKPLAALRRGGEDSRRSFDQLAITLSGLCMVHCIATAAFFTMLATSGSALLSPAIHEFGLGLAVLLGAASLGPGLMRHGDRWPAIIGFGGVALMAFGLSMHGSQVEILCTIIGVACVALGHGLSYTPDPC